MKVGLVIENDLANRENLIEELEVLGYDTKSASNGADGIASAKENLPDFILCDILMPDLSGYSVFLELKNNSSTAQIPIIFTTCLAEQKEVTIGMQLGVFGYLCKPYDLPELQSMLLSCLQTEFSAAT